MKIWITKYALKDGIKEVEETDGEFSEDGAYFFPQGEQNCISRSDWYRTREDAISRAKKMRARKIESLKKQIARLEKLNFRGDTKC